MWDFVPSGAACGSASTGVYLQIKPVDPIQYAWESCNQGMSLPKVLAKPGSAIQIRVSWLGEQPRRDSQFTQELFGADLIENFRPHRTRPPTVVSHNSWCSVAAAKLLV